MANCLEPLHSLIISDFVWFFVLLQIGDNQNDFQNKKLSYTYFTNSTHHCYLLKQLKLQHQWENLSWGFYWTNFQVILHDCTSSEEVFLGNSFFIFRDVFQVFLFFKTVFLFLVPYSKDFKTWHLKYLKKQKLIKNYGQTCEPLFIGTCWSENNLKMFGPLGVMTPCCPKHLVNLMRIDPTIANVETMVQNFIFT